jgi:hypothetical protein
MNNQQTELTIEQKLALLNDLKVVEYDLRSEDEMSLYVANDETTLEVLRKVGLSQTDIAATITPDPKVRDIAIVGFQVGANCYDPSVGWKLYTVQDKLDMLNSLDITEYEVYGDGGGYAMVAVKSETREVLHKLSYDDQYIEQHQAKVNDDEAEIDIWSIACDCGAGWFEAHGGGFSVEQPNPVVGA